jgi:hypothetical protein
MLAQDTESRLARASVHFGWGFSKGVIARRMILDGVDAQTVAREIHRQPDYIDKVRREASNELRMLAEMEAQDLPEVISAPLEDRQAQTDGEHATLLYDVRKSQRTGKSSSGPQPLEGDRDTVSAKVETRDLCLEAVRYMRLKKEARELLPTG